MPAAVITKDRSRASPCNASWTNAGNSGWNERLSRFPRSDNSIGKPTVGSRMTNAKLSCKERNGPTGTFAFWLGNGLEMKIA